MHIDIFITLSLAAAQEVTDLNCDKCLCERIGQGRKVLHRHPYTSVICDCESSSQLLVLRSPLPNSPWAPSGYATDPGICLCKAAGFLPQKPSGCLHWSAFLNAKSPDIYTTRTSCGLATAEREIERNPHAKRHK